MQVPVILLLLGLSFSSFGFAGDAVVDRDAAEYAVDPETVKAFESVDPWESFNRQMFKFNMMADTYFLKPVSQGYRFVMPTFAYRGVNNIFVNVEEIPTSAYAILQGKPKSTGNAIGRFLINFTLGFFGAFDVATQLGLKRQPEDFGQTLAVWGVPEGPYVVVPLLGPKTVRSGVGTAVDVVADPIYVDDVALRNSLFALRFVDKRANLLEGEELITGDPYVFVRDAYLQYREYLIKDGKVEDTFDTEQFDEDTDWLEE
ncbi:putative phospholipid-binding lipoprotein MlaA [BD1-7 clade bacterium]|uniref:Putative phospholipid-binding lipoprotein MlaA n=1 Tax=BD1-7 clade bacterium TaxID=2029982 RepID=A0A5S9P225_9GAMM|nr:putative phospholipid-binding lipoprotein MlaA [BD1-7 clade bacterium]CAA0122615.1 putative phospholipid-binding lipoprotein MlaA [BD1-7 clade bacterium]